MSAASPNPALRRLGFAADDVVVVVHADDVGMCGATVDAFFELAEHGLISSGSVMVPCPWFPEVAARCRGRDDVDVGVHLTLTSEWDGYRWGPISTADRTCGLIDAEGYFHRHQDAWGPIDRAAARRELEAQVDRALAAGIDVTHVDTHMCSVLHASLADDYVDVAAARGAPALLARQAGWVAALSEARIAAGEELGMPVFDHLRMMPLNGSAAGRLAVAQRMFERLPPGLTYVIAHPAVDSLELRAIAGDWRARVGDFETFRDPELTRQVRALGIEVVGWRALRDLMVALAEETRARR
ncbi:MAG TPA: polysaccharide deacetylase family protein [Solirubrobacteraceae bacterium]|nr:polysaccharide deacetylase family protein [Solirubrobacteraceae bacterium]